MSTPPRIVSEAEGHVRALADTITLPFLDECLCCYVARMLTQFGCDGTHLHSLRFRDNNAPRATALRARLTRLGACCCDCELFLNGYDLLPDTRLLEGPNAAPAPVCRGVRRGTVKPCPNWMRI